MIALCDTLYGTQIPIPHLLQDLDIATSLQQRNGIKNALDMYHNDTQPSTHISKECRIDINAHNIHDILPILDKLMMTRVIDAILKLYIVPSVPYATLTINHASHNNLIAIYASGGVYNLVYNHDRLVCMFDNIGSVKKNLCAAISAGLRVCNISVNNCDIMITDIPCIPSRIEINSKCRNITSLTPIAKSLKHVSIHASERIDDNGLRDCDKIEILDASYSNITTCEPFANTLIELNASGSCCGINDDGLRLCTRIEILNACNNANITTCAPFAKSLKILYAGEQCGLADNGLATCINICELYVIDNAKITTCTPFAKTLVKLYAPWNCGINDAGLKSCCSIKILSAHDNPRITTCVPFAKSLRILHASGYDCGICTEGLLQCHGITQLLSYDNPKINNKYIESRNKKSLRSH